MTWLSEASVWNIHPFLIRDHSRKSAISLCFSIPAIWAIMANTGNFLPTRCPSPYVDPIPPKTTQGHPRLRDQAEGRKIPKTQNATVSRCAVDWDRSLADFHYSEYPANKSTKIVQADVKLFFKLLPSLRASAPPQ
jgi:hypothetical protein